MSDPTITIDGAVVTFDASLINTTNNPISSNIRFLAIPRGVATINVTLVTANGGSQVAAFATSPFATGLPNPPFSIDQIDGQHARVTDTNLSEGAEGTFNYTIGVAFDGQTFTHDPVIINEPPVPPE